jgi:transcriptional regulator with XRE-family HTH domain
MQKKRHGRKSKQETSDHWGHRLASVLQEKSLSNRAAAKLIGIAPSLIDAWIKTGASPADLKTVKKLADSIGADFTWLLTGEYGKSQKRPSITELFQETPYFDGVARIRIDRLIPRNSKEDEDKKK